MGRRRTWPETYAKEVLGTMLELRGTVNTEVEIAHSNERRLRADMHFEPDSGRPGHGDLGIIDRIADRGPCIIEIFSAPPGPRLGLDCVGKHEWWHRQLCNQARRDGQPAPPRPGLWMITPGRPRKLIAGLDMKPMHDWPAGFWRLGMEFNAHLIVVRDVPVVPDTMPLRLLAHGKGLAQAIGELEKRPRSSRLRQRLLPLALAWLEELGKHFEEANMLFSQTKTQYDRWAEKHREEGIALGLEKGIEQGLEKGERMLLRKLLMLRFGTLPEHAEQRLEQASLAELELWAERVLTADSLAAVFAD